MIPTPLDPRVNVWHYATLIEGNYFCIPLCWAADGWPTKPGISHGQTLVRDEVTCRECMEYLHA